MNNKRILLVSPFAAGLEDKTAYPPLGVLYMAANLPRHIKSDVLIMESSDFDRYDYEVYGISVHSVGVVHFVNDLIAKIHMTNRKATILVGGAAESLVARTNYVIHIPGEGEKYFDVDTKDLDNIRFPARHLVPAKYIRHTGGVHHADEPSTTMIATRGCPYQCAFCDRRTHGYKFRKRSIYNIAQEIMQIQIRYDINWIRFVDDCITIDKRWFAELCIELGILGVKWTVLSRADCVDPKLLKLMKDSGCQELLRDKIMRFYQTAGYINTWKKPTEARV